MSKETAMDKLSRVIYREYYKLVEETMDTYAQEIAVGFAEWMNEQNWGYWSKNRWVKAGVNQTYSTSQLFQQFLTNKNEKK